MKKTALRKIFAALMVMTLILTAIVATVVPGSAAETTYTLDATKDLELIEKGAKADGETEKAGTDNFFTIHYSAKTKVDTSTKTFSDGYAGGRRLNMQDVTSIGSTITNAVEFTTVSSSVVKIWWVCGGDGREIDLYGSDGTVLQTTSTNCLKNDILISTFEIAEAGKYYIGSSVGSNNYFRIDVTTESVGTPGGDLGGETPEKTVYALDSTADLETMAAGAKADGDTGAAGTENFFTIHYSAKTKIDASSKSFDDGYTATQRLNMGGKTEIGDPIKNAVEFTTENAATVKIWWACGADGREVDLYGAGGTVIETTAVGATKNSLYISTFELAEAGKYYIGSSVGSNYYFKIEVSVENEVVPPTEAVYALDSTADLAAMAQGAKADGDTENAGTENYFTVHYSAKTKIDASAKTFEDGYFGSQRINMGGATAVGDSIKNAIEFTTEGSATVKIWWISGGDGREVDLYGADGTILETTAVGSIKNSLYISTFELTEAGKYYIGSSAGSNYYFKVEVTVSLGGAVEKPERADWGTVQAPVITGAADDGEGKLTVAVSGLVGYDGADEIIVTMFDALGTELATKRSIKESGEHSLVFEPEATGTYTFKVVANRENETPKAGVDYNADFRYPLGAPILVSATSKGQGKLEVIFTAVDEATEYEVLINGEAHGLRSTVTTVMLEGLTVGEKVVVKVRAFRDAESKESEMSLTVTVTESACQTWGFAAYGPSTNTSNNGFLYSVNEDGKVTVFSESGKGKIQPASVDGIAFYYTAIPSTYNFTLRATVTVDSWTFSNGQEGFGLMAADRIGESGNGSDFWNNSYLVGSTKFEYRYESGEDGEANIYNNHTLLEYAGFPKYTMKQGIGVIERTGVTKDNLALLEKQDVDTINNQFSSVSRTFESTCGYYGYEAGTYNILGNATKDVPGTLEDRFLKTTFIFELQRNNTGYFATYYDAEGNIIAQEKFYDPDALCKLDEENIYVGFFASRNARATFTDIELDTILPSEDKPAEARPIEYITPTVSLASPTVTTEKDYIIEVDTNVDGTLKITFGGVVLVDGVAVEGLVRYQLPTTLNYGENSIIVTFTPDPDQDLGEYVQLSTTENQSISQTIVVNKGFYHNKVIYVSPTGDFKGNGSIEYPLDIYTAVNNVIEGQTIVLLEGTYKLDRTLKIQRGMDGTADAPIKMIADPEASTRPVLDFQKLSAGIVHGGDYWYFYGFDVTNTADMQKGFQVSGNHNTLDNIHAYENGNTGIQISRYTGADTREDWPSYNLILNCTSYRNYDAGFEDADGFAAKLTIGEGNVFDGCIAYNNADDGWDLYAKVETGSIGAVIIRNCVAYGNGFVPGINKNDGSPMTGNGNGFKLGGSSLSGKHQLINCYAFYNLAKGIDSNSCPDIIVENCISYNNGSYNCAFYTNVGANTDFKANGIISFKDDDLTNRIPTLVNPSTDGVTKGEQLKGKGTQVVTDYINNTTYYWYGNECRNDSGTVLTASIFKSLNFTGITKNADGTINMNGFLELNETAPENAGARPQGTASADNSTLPTGDSHVFSETWVTIDTEYHWHECECGFSKDRGAHEFEYIIDKMPTPTVSGWKHEECSVCHRKGPKIEIYYDEIATDEDPEQNPEQNPEQDPEQNPEQNPEQTPDEDPDEDITDDTDDGLSKGAIAGIAAGSTVVAAGGGFSIVWFAVQKKSIADLGVAIKGSFTKVGSAFKKLGKKILGIFKKK